MIMMDTSAMAKKVAGLASGVRIQSFYKSYLFPAKTQKRLALFHSHLSSVQWHASMAGAEASKGVGSLSSSLAPVLAMLAP